MDTYQKWILTDTQHVHMQFGSPLEKKGQQGEDENLIKQVVGCSNSMSGCSDENEDEDDAKNRRRNGKRGNQSKNLVAERKRRKKLSERLYYLRSLVPRISKLDRASILVDAIEFVKDLEKQKKELQHELEEHSDTGPEPNHEGIQPEILGQIGGENAMTQNGFHVGTSETDKHIQQMEPQVDVDLIEGNEFLVKVLCEHKPSGLVKLMNTFKTLGMEVVHAMVTSHMGLVSNVFKVEKKDNEIVEADDIRDSLLELTRNLWTPEMTTTSENGTGSDCQHHLHQMGACHAHQLHHIHSKKGSISFT